MSVPSRCLSSPVAKSLRLFNIQEGTISSIFPIALSSFATTFASLLKALSISLTIYKPPFAKGVDDWLVEDPNGQLADLVPIAVESLQASRKQVLQEAKVVVNDEGKFERNEFNALQIIKCLYGKRLYEDKRLGIIFDGSLCPSVDKVKFDILVNLQEHIDAKFTRAVVQTATAGYLGSVTTDLVRDADATGFVAEFLNQQVGADG